ncbi:hypothetical protein [Synechococcus sp. UW105]|jgi:hypothetical protein|uniref:hypothetical protein n=1 Tax=Synechococcus sp. UW105 TaxID=337067 RepID=UPI000E0E76CD|nr:hypothetical protein [Synechococcus sp. UW105]
MHKSLTNSCAHLRVFNQQLLGQIPDLIDVVAPIKFSASRLNPKLLLRRQGDFGHWSMVCGAQTVATGADALLGG